MSPIWSGMTIPIKNDTISYFCVFRYDNQQKPGQSLHKLGLCLPKKVFIQGQLHVAFSWFSQRNGLRIMVNDEDSKEKDVSQEHTLQRNFWRYDKRTPIYILLLPLDVTVNHSTNKKTTIFLSVFCNIFQFKETTYLLLPGCYALHGRMGMVYIFTNLSETWTTIWCNYLTCFL
jgi:hypothetical protein